jgi:hypothetical protein
VCVTQKLSFYFLNEYSKITYTTVTPCLKPIWGLV